MLYYWVSVFYLLNCHALTLSQNTIKSQSKKKKSLKQTAANYLQKYIFHMLSYSRACILGITPHCDACATESVKHNNIMQQSWCKVLERWHSMSVCQPFSDLVRLSVCFTLSVIAGCVPTYVSGCLFAVSDSLSRLYLTVDVLFCLCVWVMSFRCTVPGQKA